MRRLTQAKSGARQLHELAAQAAMASGAIGARQRIKENLMHNGTLVGSGGGASWIPPRTHDRQTPWWSLNSPVIAGALILALIVSMAGALFWTQRPDPSAAPTDAPGFAVASPGTTNDNGVSDLLILEGSPTSDLTERLDQYGVLDNDGLIITLPDGRQLTLPGVESIVPTLVPGQAVIVRDDASRSVVDLTTGETLFDLPGVSDHQSWAGAYLFISESGGNEDWAIFDLRSGESRQLSEIVELPVDQPAMPVAFGRYPVDSPTVLMHFITPDFEVSPTSDIPSFLIAGSLDNAIPLEGYPPATQAQPIEQLPVVSADKRYATWITAGSDREIVVANTVSGEELVRYGVDTFGGSPAIAGFTSDEAHLVVTTDDSVLLIDWRNDGEAAIVVRDSLENIANPLLYGPGTTLYFRQGDTLMRLNMANDELTTVLSDLAPPPVRFVAPDSPWLVANDGENFALIDARSGEVVSHLTDVPPNQAQYGTYSTAISFDGSTVLQIHGGLRSDYHAYVVSPRFPDGVVLTAPIDPASVQPDRAFPVNFMLSPDGTSVVAGTQGDTGFIPRYIGSVAPEPDWLEIDSNVSGSHWIPMPETEPDSDNAKTLPAQDFATPAPDTDATPAATPQSATSPSDLFIISDGEIPSANAGGAAFGTLDDDGLTLPTASGDPVTIPDVVRVDRGADPGQAVITRSDNSRAVINLATGDIIFDLPVFARFQQSSSSYLFTPTDDTYTDWTLIDLVTGDTRLLSDVIDLPDDTSVLPLDRIGTRDVRLVRVQEVVMDDLELTPTSTDVGRFVIAGSLNRAVPLPELSSSRTQISPPSLAVNSDGSILAYGTQDDDSRIVILDTATGDELARFGSDAVGDDPSLAGFTEDDQLIVGASGSLLALDVNAEAPVTVVADGFEAIDDLLLYAPAGMVYARQIDTILQVDLASGETREIATGWAPREFNFTKPDSGWITFLTRDGQMLVDARTGEIVSQMQAPANRAEYTEEAERWPGWTDGYGDTVIFALEYTYIDREYDGTPGAVWLLSPEFPNGLEITAPDDSQAGTYWLSQDGSTLYTYMGDTFAGLAGDSLGSPGDLWATPLSTEPDWRLVAEDIIPKGIFPLGGQPEPASDSETLPARDFATREATPAARQLDSLFQANAVPVFSSGPVDELSPDRYGAVSDEGLTLPLRNGEVATLPDAVRVSQVLHADIAIIVNADDSRTSIDLTNGETLAELYPTADYEQIVGVYQFTPANDDLTDWRILDLRTGDETSTSEISGGPFDQEVSAIQIAGSLDAPDHALAQFVIPSSTGELVPWQGLSTGEGPASGTLVIPGSLADTRFIEGSVGTTDPWRATTALLVGDEPLVAYVTAVGDERVVVEHAVTGEQVAT
jgi:hypothetical protein